MLVVGITGGIGCGKSEAARLFAEQGVPVIDTDAIAHQLTDQHGSGYAAIVQAFGTEFVRADGQLDRAKLRQSVFSDEGSRAQLQQILHPLIRAVVTQELHRYDTASYVLVVVPLLFETHAYDEIVQYRIVVDCDESLQIRRTMARSHLTQPEVEAIMHTQCTRAERLRQADAVLDNQAGLAELSRQILQLHQQLLRSAHQHSDTA